MTLYIVVWTGRILSDLIADWDCWLPGCSLSLSEENVWGMSQLVTRATRLWQQTLPVLTSPSLPTLCCPESHNVNMFSRLCCWCWWCWCTEVSGLFNVSILISVKNPLPTIPFPMKFIRLVLTSKERISFNVFLMISLISTFNSPPQSNKLTGLLSLPACLYLGSIRRQGRFGGPHFMTYRVEQYTARSEKKNTVRI